MNMVVLPIFKRTRMCTYIYNDLYCFATSYSLKYNNTNVSRHQPYHITKPKSQIYTIQLLIRLARIVNKGRPH